MEKHVAVSSVQGYIAFSACSGAHRPFFCSIHAVVCVAYHAQRALQWLPWELRVFDVVETVKSFTKRTRRADDFTCYEVIYDICEKLIFVACSAYLAD